MKWNILQLFKRKSKLPFTDESFVKLEFNSSSLDPAILAEVDQALADEKQPLLSKTLPWATFKQAETLFETVLASGNTLFLDRISIARFDENGQPTVENEIFAVDVAVDGVYASVLEPLIDASLQSPDFASFAYSDKKNYFEKLIFPAYATSMGYSEEDLAPYPLEKVEQVLPTQEVVPEELDEGSVEEVSEEPSELDFLDELATQSQPPSERPIPTHQESVVEHQPSSLGNHPWSRQEMVVQQPIRQRGTGMMQQIVFPRFVLHPLDKSHYEPHESGYVEWRANQEMARLNEQLQASEDQTNQFASRSLQQDLQAIEQAEYQKIQQKINRKDKRSGLKERVRKSILKRKQEEESKELANLQKALNAKIEEAKKIYEASLSQAAKEFEEAEVDLHASLNEKYFQLANQEYQEQYAAATIKLQNFLDGELVAAQQLKENQALLISSQLTEKGAVLGQSLFEQAEVYLEQLKKELQKEHQWAVQLDVINRLESLKETSEADYQETIQELLAENKQLRANEQQLLKDKLELAGLSMAHHVAALQQQEELLVKKPQADTDSYQEDSISQSIHKITPSFLSFKGWVPIALASILCLGIGGIAYQKHLYAATQREKAVQIAEEKAATEASLEESSKQLDKAKEALASEKALLTSHQEQFKKDLDLKSNQITILQEQNTYLKEQLYSYLGYIPEK